MNSTRTGGWNRAGMLVSAGCAIHCTAFPIMSVVVPALGVRYAASDRLEWGTIALTVVVGVAGHGEGYLRHHGQAGPALLFLFGVGVIVFVRWFDLSAAIVAATFGLGGVLASGAQLLNVRYCRKCDAKQQ
jgi:hypothetical protein